jgi:hypothetical protein
MAWTVSNTWLINTGSNYDLLMDAGRNPQFVANCEEMYNYLTGRGWTHNATCAVMGNACYESSVNPGMYERDSGRPVYQSGYGLIQWTNVHATSEDENTLIAWCIEEFGDRNWANGDRQCQFIDTDDGNNWIIKSSWNITYNDFKVSNSDLSYLTRAYFENRERGTWSSLRYTYASRISDYFQGVGGYPIVITRDGNGEAWASIDEVVRSRAEAGTAVQLAAVPNDDDVFLLWTVDYPSSLQLNEPVTVATNGFTMPADKVNLTAHFTGATPTPPTPPTPPPVYSIKGRKRMPIWMYPLFRTK